MKVNGSADILNGRSKAAVSGSDEEKSSTSTYTYCTDSSSDSETELPPDNGQSRVRNLELEYTAGMNFSTKMANPRLCELAATAKGSQGTVQPYPRSGLLFVLF